MTLLSIVQDAAAEIGIPSPSAVIGVDEPQTRQLLALANRDGKRLRDAHEWMILQILESFNTVASQEAYSLPSDYRSMISDTFWDRADFDRVRGQLTPQEWQEIKSGLLGSGVVNRRFRIQRDNTATPPDRKIYIDPIPASSGEEQVFEYVSKAWTVNAAGTSTSTEWTMDDDMALLDEDLLTMGLIWRFRSRKGFNVAIDIAEWEAAVTQAIAFDVTATKLSLTHVRLPVQLIGPWNVPETGFG